MAGTQLELPAPPSSQGPVTKVITVFEGTEDEYQIEIDVMGWRGNVTSIRHLPRNNTDAIPVSGAR